MKAIYSMTATSIDATTSVFIIICIIATGVSITATWSGAVFTIWAAPRVALVMVDSVVTSEAGTADSIRLPRFSGLCRPPRRSRHGAGEAISGSVQPEREGEVAKPVAAAKSRRRYRCLDRSLSRWPYSAPFDRHHWARLAVFQIEVAKRSDKEGGPPRREPAADRSMRAPSGVRPRVNPPEADLIPKLADGAAGRTARCAASPAHSRHRAR